QAYANLRIQRAKVTMAAPLLSVLLKNLNTLILEEFGLLWGVHKDMKKLISELSAIQAVLEDAEEKQLSNRAIRDWLRKLKHAAYELDDILDDCSTEALKWEYKGQSSGSLKKATTSLLIYPVEHIIFLHKIGTRMKAITEELSAIAEERNKYNLQVSVADKHVEHAKSRETSSDLTESLLLGRDEDKEKIIKVLVEDVCDSEGLSVYPIVGMGGLGKTTLAQMVYNDYRVKSHFEPRIWVYVSQHFDSKRMIKTTIESASGKACEVLDLDSLKRRLRELLDGKRYLIALDDVWNEDQEEWGNLKSSLACGAKGASLIVTTRLRMVAEIMGTVPPHHLSSLSNDDCWVLFKQRAFGHENEVRPNLEAIGKEIVKKCGGVPLAAKAIGGLLRFKKEEKGWLSIKESEIWNLHDENSILPALRLSYNSLPLGLRRCFAYCAIFPKGSRIWKEDLIHHWMANGYVSGKKGQELEDIGEDICNELFWRSFFQVVDKVEINEMFIFRTMDRGYKMHEIGCATWFKIHDLVHDLAQSVMEDEGWMKGTENSRAMSNKMVRCVSSSMLQQENHEARFPFRWGKSNFKKFDSLRVACDGGGEMSNLPSSIGNLKHLRYLDISRAYYIKQLPDSICSLWNLQTLNLDYCRELERLPKNMNYLRGLRHLYLTECPLSDMPPKIGQLTCLKTLSLFVVGKSMKCSQLAELQRLNLGGQLCIEHLERVRSPTDAKANLVEKKNLCFLKLSWGSIAESESQENVEEVLEALEPHPNLKGLVINNYGGTHWPRWMRNSIPETIVVIELRNCKNCFQLPSLGQLPLLRRLEIVGMDKVEYIDGDLCCEGPVRGFPSLEKLEISRLPNLKGLSREEGRELLPRLCEIEVRNCPKLRFPCLSSPKVLGVFGGCTNVVLNSISNLNSLTSLAVRGNEEVICFPKELLRNLTLLESLKIERFSKLKMFPDELARLVALKSLYISRCPELVAFPEGVKHLNSLRDLTLDGGRMLHDTDVKSVPWIEGVQHIPALESLSIRNYYEITSLPDWLGNLRSLQSLYIWDCPKIASLPTSIQGLTKLNELDIRDCSPKLKKRCQRGTGEDWDKIAHVPRVCINDDLQ
ncbi:hypothetical protein U1Q18_019025, partial [Sarracenia purpurea var. burkii]